MASSPAGRRIGSNDGTEERITGRQTQKNGLIIWVIIYLRPGARRDANRKRRRRLPTQSPGLRAPACYPGVAPPGFVPTLKGLRINIKGPDEFANSFRVLFT